MTGKATLLGDGNPAGPAACVQLGGRLTDTVCSRGWLNNLPVRLAESVTTHCRSQHAFLYSLPDHVAGNPPWQPGRRSWVSLGSCATGQRSEDSGESQSPRAGRRPGAKVPKSILEAPLTASQARKVRLTRRAIQFYVYGLLISVVIQYLSKDSLGRRTPGNAPAVERCQKSCSFSGIPLITVGL